MFLVVEGVDCAGKSSMIQSLKKIIEEKENQSVETFRNPGGTVIGEKIRDIFKDETPRTKDVDYALLLASRLSLSHAVTEAIQAGKVAIVDRWDSSAHVNQADPEVEILKSNIVYNVLPAHEDNLRLEIPDYCILLDPSIEVVKHRKGLRNKRESTETDRYEVTAVEDLEAWFKRQSESFRMVASVIPGGFNWQAVLKRLEKAYNDNQVLAFTGLLHPSSKRQTHGALLYVPVKDIHETPEELAMRVYQGLSLALIDDAHYLDIPKDLEKEFKDLTK